MDNFSVKLMIFVYILSFYPANIEQAKKKKNNKKRVMCRMTFETRTIGNE